MDWSWLPGDAAKWIGISLGILAAGFIFRPKDDGSD